MQNCVISCKKFLYFCSKVRKLIPLIGTYECKVDSKFRLPLPIGLQRELAGVLADGFVLKRSIFQYCLELYPKAEWLKVMEDLNKLNRNVMENNTLIRNYTAGLKMVDVDSTNRIQIARDLVAHAGIAKDVVLHPSVNMIEIWDKDRYEKAVDISQEDFIALAERVLGDSKNNDSGVS